MIFLIIMSLQMYYLPILEKGGNLLFSVESAVESAVFQLRSHSLLYILTKITSSFQCCHLFLILINVCQHIKNKEPHKYHIGLRTRNLLICC